MLGCAVYGHDTWTDRVVIWNALAEGWGLSAEERHIVERQQGTCCAGCGRQPVASALVVEIP